jgi:acetyltransferase-like isoleucine patch superfamily enzyme
MRKDETTAVRSYSLTRIFRKLAMNLCASALIPSSLRARLIALTGVNFTDARSTFVGTNVYFDNIHPEMITIGKSCLITTGSRFLTHFLDARHEGTPNWPFHFQSGKVVVGDYVFVGSGAVISKPLTIGDWAIVGANAVVTRDVPEGAIVLGSPARVVGYRTGFGPEITDTPPEP